MTTCNKCKNYTSLIHELEHKNGWDLLRELGRRKTLGETHDNLAGTSGDEEKNTSKKKDLEMRQ